VRVRQDIRMNRIESCVLFLFLPPFFSLLLLISGNDYFLLHRAWKKQLAPEGSRKSQPVLLPLFISLYEADLCPQLSKTAIRFIADDQSLFVSGLGLLMDGTGALGGPRAKVTNPSMYLTLILTHVTCVSFYTALRHYRD
jgi:hypothetical protein